MLSCFIYINCHSATGFRICTICLKVGMKISFEFRLKRKNTSFSSKEMKTLNFTGTEKNQRASFPRIQIQKLCDHFNLHLIFSSFLVSSLLLLLLLLLPLFLSSSMLPSLRSLLLPLPLLLQSLLLLLPSLRSLLLPLT